MHTGCHNYNLQNSIFLPLVEMTEKCWIADTMSNACLAYLVLGNGGVVGVKCWLQILYSRSINPLFKEFKNISFMEMIIFLSVRSSRSVIWFLVIEEL